jgi:8-oxo-dGTP pyrophosphatase MutT (NUDIX family)
MESPIKIAVCCFILDKNKNLMITKRPQHLKIFPNVWVLPGGLVEFQESLELALFRELEEETGLTFEFRNDEENEGVRMISPLRFDQPDELAVKFAPYYLYESVTHNVLDQVAHLSGYQDRPPQAEGRPPVSQHLCLFYKAQIDESFERILIEVCKAEVHRLVWAGLPQLADAFKGKHSTIPGFEYDPSVLLHEAPNCQVKTDRLWPLFQENSH